MTHGVRRITVLWSLAVTLLVGGACTTTAVSTQPASTPAPLPTVVVPTIPPPTTFDTDDELAARFPRSIAGSRVDVQTIGAATFLGFVRENDPDDLAEVEALFASIGVGLDAISVGAGGFTYQGSPELLQALRARGADGSRLLQAVIRSEQQDADDPSAVETTTGTVGGKPVTIVTIRGETTTYIYGAGDVVWVFEGDDAAVADTVMRAIP